MNELLVHYGVDWLAIGMSLYSVYMLGNKNRWGFILFAASNVLWIFLGLTWMSSIGMAVGNFAFMIINIRGFFRWHQEQEKENLPVES